MPRPEEPKREDERPAHPNIEIQESAELDIAAECDDPDSEPEELPDDLPESQDNF